MPRLFSPGCLRITPRISELIIDGFDIPPYLSRHLCGDWGNISERDKEKNNHAVRYGGRLLSSYDLTPEIDIWILTDDGVTTIMLPVEY